MRSRLGVRGHLLLAFLGISAFAVLGAGAALYSFREIDSSLGLITQRRIPVVVQSQELSRHAERITAAAPALLTVTSQAEKDEWAHGILIEVSTLNELLAQLRQDGVESAALHSLESGVEKLRSNLQALDRLVDQRLALGEQKKELIGAALQIAAEVQNLLGPWVSVMDERIAQWRRIARKTPAYPASAALLPIRSSRSPSLGSGRCSRPRFSPHPSATCFSARPRRITPMQPTSADSAPSRR